MKVTTDELESNKIHGKNIPMNDYVATDTEEFNIKEDYINTLKDQLKVKDLQLNEKDGQLKQKDIQLKQKDIQISELHNLIENSQILLKEKPHQDVLLLEEHFKDLDTKLLNIKEQMQEKKDQQGQKQKGFLSKIFKK